MTARLILTGFTCYMNDIRITRAHLTTDIDYAATGCVGRAFCSLADTLLLSTSVGELYTLVHARREPSRDVGIWRRLDGRPKSTPHGCYSARRQLCARAAALDEGEARASPSSSAARGRHAKSQVDAVSDGAAAPQLQSHELVVHAEERRHRRRKGLSESPFARFRLFYGKY